MREKGYLRFSFPVTLTFERYNLKFAPLVHAALR